MCVHAPSRGGSQVPLRSGAAGCTADARACRRGGIRLGVDAADVSCACVSRAARDMCTVYREWRSVCCAASKSGRKSLLSFVGRGSQTWLLCMCLSSHGRRVGRLAPLVTCMRGLASFRARAWRAAARLDCPFGLLVVGKLFEYGSYG